jgi:ABC-type microcin C transport system permease subunit YejB
MRNILYVTSRCRLLAVLRTKFNFKMIQFATGGHVDDVSSNLRLIRTVGVKSTAATRTETCDKCHRTDGSKMKKNMSSFWNVTKCTELFPVSRP